MKIKLNMDLKNFKKGQIIDVPAKDGIATNQFWRNRIKDSAIDKCVEVLVEKKVEKPAEKVAGKPEDKTENKIEDKGRIKK